MTGSDWHRTTTGGAFVGESMQFYGRARGADWLYPTDVCDAQATGVHVGMSFQTKNTEIHDCILTEHAQPMGRQRSTEGREALLILMGLILVPYIYIFFLIHKLFLIFCVVAGFIWK